MLLSETAQKQFLEAWVYDKVVLEENTGTEIEIKFKLESKLESVFTILQRRIFSEM